MKNCCLFLALGLALQAFASMDVEWNQFKGIKKGSYYTTVEDDPWLFSVPFVRQPDKNDHYLLVGMSTSKPIMVELRWLNDEKQFDVDCQVSFPVSQIDVPVVQVVDLDKFGGFHSMDVLRLDPGNDEGVKFRIDRLEFISKDEIPPELLAGLIEFRGYTSKLHYLPEEAIEYRATLISRHYPERRSPKLLTANVVDENGKIVVSHFQQYGLPGIYQIKELYGVMNQDGGLKPGKYRLETVSLDMLTGLELKSSHEFGVLSDGDPYVYETPFKYVKDFSIIRDPEGVWHVFSITGDFFEGHDWQVDGHERTFSHGTSKDLRHWEYHPPVLCISENYYPDGNGKYEDKGVWAPHVIEHNGTYYMFYTSTNERVSQSISLATSKDLFNWKKHGKNPIVTLEDAEWALWRRDGWADCRDPAILRDGQDFYMYFTAQAKDGKGAVAVCKSRDLVRWSVPEIAASGKHAMESPQVWKHKGRYFMTTSSTGAAVWESAHPAKGWAESDFPRPPVQAMEKHVGTSPSYAEEVVPLDGDSLLMASITWRHWGNSIYLSKTTTDNDGTPVRYESPFGLDE